MQIPQMDQPIGTVNPSTATVSDSTTRPPAKSAAKSRTKSTKSTITGKSAAKPKTKKATKSAPKVSASSATAAPPATVQPSTSLEVVTPQPTHNQIVAQPAFPPQVARSQRTAAPAAPHTQGLAPEPAPRQAAAARARPKPRPRPRTTSTAAAPSEPNPVGTQPLADEEPPAQPPTGTRTSQRPRATTERAATSTNEQLRAQAARVAARDKRARRQEYRVQQANLAATVEQDGDNEEMREMRGKSRRAI